MKHQHFLAILAVLSVSCVGCKRGPYEIAAVSGRITVNGQPVAKVAVMFQPIAPEDNPYPGPGSTGVTDADGRYTLAMVVEGKQVSGAVVGKHKVRITNFAEYGNPFDDRPTKQAKPLVLIPARYNDIKAWTDFDVP